MLFHPLALAIAIATVPSSADAKGKIVNILSWQSSTKNVNVDAPAAVKDAIMADSDDFDRDERQLPNKETVTTEYCFTSKEALQTVVNAYIDQDCSTISDCAIRQKYGEIGTWCTTGITDMSYLFQSSSFNDDISGWDVSSVTDMTYMFYYASGFNQPLNGWDVSKVTNMGYTFNFASSFNQPLDGWDVSKVTGMYEMFGDAPSFNQPLDGWNVTSVTDMSGMFYYASSFNQPLNGWDVSSVIDMSSMFIYATSFNQPLNGWDVSSVAGTMYRMFYYASGFNQPLDGWNVSSVTDMYEMFNGASSFNQNLCAWGQFPSFPYGYTADMFLDSGCTYQDSPMQAISGPFCASDCLTSVYI